MKRYVLGLENVDQDQVALAGGKAASLGELSRIEGVSVPDGFCVTTEAFRLAWGERKSFAEVPEPVAAAISSEIERRGDAKAWAVRSSATAEDLPGTSFAGQHDSFLNLVGTSAVLEHIRLCWGSLFSDRAIAYRRQQEIEERDLAMAVVVQEMVQADAAGVLFTADPLTSNREVASIEAVHGLGEDLVSGRVNPDIYKLRQGELIERSIAAEHRGQPVLGDQQVLELVELGRRIEAHFGSPRDIEWCLADGGFHFVQSRPITTLFPVPEADDSDPHVYVSVGHQQMMTEAMKPLGLSLWQLTTPRPMREAGSRLFVDVAPALASPASREQIVGALGGSDPLIGDALETIVERGFVPEPTGADTAGPSAGAPPGSGSPEPVEADPGVTAALIERHEDSLAELRREIAARSGLGLLAFIRADLENLRANLFDPRGLEVITATMEATRWVNERMKEWLGETNAADELTRSAPGNPSAEMGLALLEVADQIRPYPEVVTFLERVQADDDGYLDRLGALDGGAASERAIRSYLERYGMRCVGEIDITRPRWSEHPAALVATILQHVKNSEPGEAERRFEGGRQAALAKERDLLERLRTLPDGESKAAETACRIDLIRTFTGYREYPKFGMVSRYFVYKQALLKEATRLVRDGVLETAEDFYYLRFGELEEVVRTGQADQTLIHERRHRFHSDQTLTPPRVMTSEGEVLDGEYRRDDLPAEALVGLAVSSGTVEGRARVIEDPARADVEPGDILVTAFTDPSWAPVFVGIAGLVTEVGGLMTHGAVVAREYGLPAVVGVEGATRRIRDGQVIRVYGTEGYVLPLDPESES